jgi:hypothetical protein
VVTTTGRATAVLPPVLATAERLDIDEIATIDRRHFTVVQTRLGAITLLP